VFSPVSGQGPLTFGTIDSLSGKITVYNKWDPTSLVHIVGSIAAHNPASEQFYSGTC
jgi:hypothetical protein